jgi:UDP-GlcNAc:undecaprenyl-phosphate/decaprenyl-phosphate GlcNAc-1-phosphate transferase
MIFTIVAITLFIIEVVYFKIADYYNIIDKPNSRSSHTEITIRGGGIIFWVSTFIYFIYFNYDYPYFFIGLSLVTFISFLDDIFTLSNRYRLPFQFMAIGLVLYQLHFFENPLWMYFIGMIVGVGIINAYNFMDGINGITSGYSTIVVLALWFVNNHQVKFIENDFLIFTLLGLLVFNYFNFRTKAKCFAGDVGSISIAVIILFLLLKLILQEQNLIYILFLSVYGVDSVLTIIHRLLLKENIFKAHRLHLFQVLVNNLKVPHLIMSSIYMLIQGIISYIIIFNLQYSTNTQMLTGFSIIFLLSTLYIIMKRKALALTV